MLFWPILIIGAAVLAVFLAGGPGNDMLTDDESQMRAVYLIVLALCIIFGGAGRMIYRGGRRSFVHALAWMGIFAVAFVGYSFRHELNYVVDRVKGELMPSMALTRTTGEVELRRAWDGHYRAEVELNGVPVRMMVDTGASMVLIPYEDVAGMGIDPKALIYSVPVTTANGRSTVAPIRLNSVKIGPIEIENVEAAVSHPGKLRNGLLGMSFLERLSETSFVGDKLILRLQGGGAGREGFIPVNRQGG